MANKKYRQSNYVHIIDNYTISTNHSPSKRFYYIHVLQRINRKIIPNYRNFFPLVHKLVVPKINISKTINPIP